MNSKSLAGALDFGSESRQIHAVGDDRDVRLLEQRAILLRHDHHFG